MPDGPAPMGESLGPHLEAGRERLWRCCWCRSPPPAIASTDDSGPTPTCYRSQGYSWLPFAGRAAASATRTAALPVLDPGGQADGAPPWPGPAAAWNQWPAWLAMASPYQGLTSFLCDDPTDSGRLACPAMAGPMNGCTGPATGGAHRLGAWPGWALQLDGRNRAAPR